jgi:peptidoglycan-N-acetylglucosamine deacetylase
MRRAAVAFLSAVALAVSAQAKPAQAPEIALTFDDLPVHGPFPPRDTPETVANAIVAALTRAHVPAYGFVNAHWVADRPDTIHALKAWRAAGLMLGSHGWSHQHLNAMTVPQFEEELTKDEPVLEQVASGTDWRWFRYPFLDEGETAAKRQASRDVLARRGYKIADVTMDFGDWQWTAPYARCSAAGDQASIAKLEQMYVAAAREAISYYRGLSHQLFGRDIPYVVLLHESPFEARMVPRLIEIYRSAGFRFLSLPVAESDPYYSWRVHPQFPEQPNALDDTGPAGGLKLPHRTDYGALLPAMCPAATAPRTVP